MRIFVTGATGFIGSAIVQELIRSGHQVLGLTRSDAGAQSLVGAGAQVHRGDLEDLASLRAGAANADAVIHTAFNHDFSKYLANCASDRRVIEALGDALANTGRLLIVTSGTGVLNSAPGHPCTEDDPPPSSKVVPRAASEEAAASVADRGVRVAIVRLPQIHDTVKQGLVSYAIRVAREKGVSAYIGNGLNRWPAAHRLDTARLYRLALEKGDGGVRYHAVAEEGVPFRNIAESIGRGLGVPVISIAPEEAAGHFSWLAEFIARDIPASSEQTRKVLGWSPTGPGLIADLDEMRWFEAVRRSHLQHQ
jgi:nucleoside-diphosphate-sugar epimerase